MKNNQQLSKTEHWEMLIKNWSSSSKSMRKWCLENSIPINTFRYWRDKFSSQELDKTAFVEILEEQSIGIEIRYQGFEIHISKEFNEQALVRCLSAMRRGLC